MSLDMEFWLLFDIFPYLSLFTFSRWGFAGFMKTCEQLLVDLGNAPSVVWFTDLYVEPKHRKHVTNDQVPRIT